MHTPIRRIVLLAATLLSLGCSPAEQPAHGPADASTASAQPAAASAPLATSTGMVVENAWIRSAPPGAPALAGYATLRNPGTAAITVRTCPSDGFASTELHETLHEDGMARMRPLPELVVPATGQLMLAPGAAHLMLTQPAALPAVGDRVMVCLSVDGETRQVAFEVRAASGAALSPDHDHSGEHEH